MAMEYDNDSFFFGPLVKNFKMYDETMNLKKLVYKKNKTKLRK